MAELTYPNVANYNGIPLLKGNASVADGKVTITFEPHKFSEQWTGGFWVWVTNAIAAPGSGETPLPVFFNTQGGGNEYPLLRFSGVQATNALLATSTGGVLQCFFNSSNNRLQLVAIV